jgi:ABC-type branched-subunit amino acid transport system ATPase component
LYDTRRSWEALSRLRSLPHDLAAGYGDSDILRGLSLRVDAGELVAVIGPNGAGKSTLLKTLAGLVRPRAGRIALGGADVTGAGTGRIVASGLCYVPQEANVFPSFSVWENLTIGAWTAAAPMGERARAVVELFPALATRRRARAGTLSGGERQMLAIAMALMVEPRLLLLDEPSAGLAPALQRLVFDRIREINDQTSAEAGVRAARKLIDVNKVVAIVSTWASAVTLAVKPLCVEAKVFVIGVSGACRAQTP